MPLELRLTDFLNTSDVLAVRDMTLYALDDGRLVVVGDHELPASQLWAVEPTDTGVTAWHADLRVATRSVRIDIEMSPYRIRGTLHSVGSQRRLATANHRRRRMVPLTDAEITFSYFGEEMTRKSPVIIINRDHVLRIYRLASMRPAPEGAEAGITIPVP